MENRLFCTFTEEYELENTIEYLVNRYTINFDKIFILSSPDTEELICTYNMDFGNISNFPLNTILVHRKKETNTLYTINALNVLIKQLNNGILDSNYKINWDEYRNSILLIKDLRFKKLNTTLKDIRNIM